MRKKFLSCVIMVIVTFVVGVNVVKAEDYTFSTKVYKVDVVDDNFITRYNNGEFQEVQSGGTLNVGDTIAVGVYVDVKNATGNIFDIRLNWDDSILDVVIDSTDDFMYYFYDDRSQFNGGLFPNISATSKKHSWWFDCYLYLDEEKKEGPKIKSVFYDKNDNTTFNKSGILYWVPFTIKDSVSDNVNLNFDFSIIDVYTNYGRTKIETSFNSSSFKINGKKSDFYSLGDVNGNGKIDFGDVMLSMAFYMIELPMEPNEKDAADMNGDGRITLSDTLLILDKLKGSN